MFFSSAPTQAFRPPDQPRWVAQRRRLRLRSPDSAQRMATVGRPRPGVPAGACAQKPQGPFDLPTDLAVRGAASLVVYVAGELDMLTGPPLQDHLGELLATRPDRLIIDLGQVSFMGSTGLSVLICIRQNAIAMGTTLQLSGTSARAISVPLEVTGLNHLFEILPTPPTTGDAGH